MSDNAHSMLYEVMEQQLPSCIDRMSIAKVEIIASLNLRTLVLACANPSGSRYNPRLLVIDNIQLPPTLLSRFDLIYLVLDKANEQIDWRIARHLVALHYDETEDQTLDALDLPNLKDSPVGKDLKEINLNRSARVTQWKQKDMMEAM
ncbi:hypothetical protein SUGI_0377360 [Cryptomeria japonica]|nr:hypothetical protein SUGI_0377360 [Cryptomeria japonica]